MHDASGNGTDKRERRANIVRRSGKMARAGDATRKRYGRDGDVERLARDGTESLDRTGRRR